MDSKLLTADYLTPECEELYDGQPFVLCSSYVGDEPEEFVDCGTEEW